MTKVVTFLSAQLAVAAVALSMSGAAFAQEIGCVNGTPAPPITHSCPSISPAGAFAQEPASHVSSRAPRHHTYVARNAVRHVAQ